MLHYTLLSWLIRGSANYRRSRRPGSGRRPPVVPRLLTLEDRALPSTLTVLNTADDGQGSLRAVIAKAQSGDQIVFDLSMTGQIITLTSGELAITKDLDIEGLGAEQLTVSGNHHSRVFDISGGVTVTIAGLTITDGLVAPATSDALGGGIFNNGGDVTLVNVIVQNNVARGADVATLAVAGHNGFGGGIYSTGGALTLAGATLAGNQASGGRGGDSSRSLYRAGAGGLASGAGLYASGGALDISDSRIVNNRTTGGPGGDGDLPGDGGDGAGAGIYATGGPLNITNTTLSGNTVRGGNGGRYTDKCGRTFRCDGSDGSGKGGGLYASGGLLTLTNAAISANTGSGGAGLYVGGTATISNSTLSGNSGGGIANSGMLTVSNSILSGNSGGNGGGIYNSGTLTVSNSTLSGNSAFEGGGIYDDGGAFTLTNVTLTANRANTGGGIYNFIGTLTVSNSTLSGNSASFYGGGIYDNGGTVTVTNVTLTANRANTGGGIYNFYGTLTVSNSTLSGNSATGNGGGLYLYQSSPVLHNTLIAGNFRGTTSMTRDDVSGALNPGGDYNLIGDGSGMTGLSDGVNGNQVGSAGASIDPLLGPLQDNGGPTQTLALLPGSPALNAGDPTQLGTADQRGVARRGGVNIGAFQASATAFVLTAPDTVPAGEPFDVTVTAVDPFGQVAVGYTGTITFSTTDPDPGVVLPADYTFTPDDGGSVSFLSGVTLMTPGDQTLAVVDTADDTITGSALMTVDGTAPGTGAYGLDGRLPAKRLPGSAPRASERSPGQMVAVDGWFASLHAGDVGLALAQPIDPTRDGADWWALDPWQGDEPLLT